GWRAAGLDEPVGTQIANGAQHSMVVPPAFLASYYATDKGHALDEALPTLPTHDRHALVRMPFYVSAYGDKEGYARNPVRAADEVMPTTPTVAVHRLAQPGPTPDVEDCGFRMLEPHEIKRAMAFRDDYIIYGNKREQVKQAGNAVTPPAMRLLVERCLATLD
ncbi:MAG: DNA cytosine methyltransferase, partial [Thermomicrobiales bacterium]